MKNPDPRAAAVRKLAILADEPAGGASFPVTRLTVLKRLCAEWQDAAPFACYLADLSLNRFRANPPSRLDPERRDAFSDRMETVVACIHACMAAPARDAELALRAAHRELESAQNKTRDTRWATVRTIHSRDALAVENAARCILEPRNAAAWWIPAGARPRGALRSTPWDRAGP